MPILNEKQNEFIRNATHRYNIKSGAVRSGKSFGDISYVIPAGLREVKDETGLNVIMGVSKETVERNVLQPMREIYTSDIVGTINSRNIAIVCGVPVYCLGAEKASQVAKIQGSSIKFCYGDEIARWSPNVFDMLKSRLDKPYSRFYGSCNPESPSHWLKQFIDSENIDIYVQKYTIFDNPALSKEFVDNLCKEYEGTVYYNRLILGEWTLAEGLIYPMYKDAIQEPPKDENGNIKLAEQYGLSIDYGTLNAFAALLWGKYGDVWYAIDGYYYSGRDTGTLLTDEEYGQEIDDKFGRYTSEYARLPVIVDPSAASFITLLKRKMRYKVIQADNSVLDGIRETATAMKIGKIKISPNLKDWIREAEGYVWDDSCVEDRPIKVNDHYMDSTRYFVKTMRLLKPQTKYKPIWN
jgi:PBSX family phage terminase large subunit